MSPLTNVITSQRSGDSQPLARRSAAGRRSRTAGRVRRARPLPAPQRQSLRARAGPVLPLRHPSLSRPVPRIRPWPRAHPVRGLYHLLKRRFEEAIAVFLAAQAAQGPSAAISSALAAGYRALGFQTLADQVRRSVRSVRGNQWMFRAAHPADDPLRMRPELLRGGAPNRFFPSCARPRRSAWI